MEIRISVANLVPRLIVEETGETHFIGLLNRRHFQKGHRVYGAIGGAAEMTIAGKVLLILAQGATFEKERDARFLIQQSNLKSVLTYFEDRDQTICEIDPIREIQEELTGTELPEIPPVLTENQASQIQVQYARSVYPRDSLNVARNWNGEGQMPTVHYFHLFEMIVPQTIFEILCGHPAIKLFTEKELASTQMGLVRGTSADGSSISSNLFW